MRVFSHIWQLTRLKLVLIWSGAYFNILILLMTNRSSQSRSQRLTKLGKQLNYAMQTMGPAYIKLGQFLSTRPDLVGREIGDALATLQDSLPHFPYHYVKRTIHKELGKQVTELFDEFIEQPVAAASIAQVHKAVTKEGDVVAVKVLRPRIEQRFENDLALFGFLALIGEFLFAEIRRLKPTIVVETLRDLVKTELDLRLEAAASGKLAENLRDDNNVYIPTINWQYTNKRVLTMEWIDGIVISDRNGLKQQGHSPHKIAKKMAITFFNQAFRDGFFHADIHPGNILVNQNGQICLLDFGIMGHLPLSDRAFIAEILHGFITRDYQRVADLHFAAGYVPAHQNRQLFALACRSIGEPIIGLPVNRISLATLLQQLFEISHDFEMETQPQLLMLQKTMVTIEGAGLLLYPEVNMWQLAEPWIMEWAKDNLGWHNKLRTTGTEIMGIARNFNNAITSISNWQQERLMLINKRRKGFRAFILSFMLGAGSSALLFWLMS